MPMVPVRDLGGVGVIRDVSPYDLSINSVSDGNNVRFENGKISRTPSYREVQALTPTNPRHIFTIKIPNVADRIGIATDTGLVYTYLNGVEAVVTPASGAVSTSSLPYTHTTLAGLSYLNRSDRVPVYFGPAVSVYTDLPNWTSTHRCRVLRGFKSYLIAVDVSKAGTNYPTMIKWSDTAQYGSVPGSWDETDPTTNAGENTLAEASTPFLDGLPLRNSFVIYNSSQAFMMTESGNLDVFNFRKLFDNRGIINTNCVAEVQGLHYVFGFNDIYVHDGSSYRSIIEGRNKQFLFGSLNYQNTTACYVQHDPIRNEVLFAYESGDGDTKFKSATDCNKHAIFNYVSNTWSFADSPNTVGMTQANIDSFRTYNDVTTGYNVTGGTYYELETGESQHQFATGPVDGDGLLTSARLYGYDPIQAGLLPYALSTEANADAYAGRIGIDLDEASLELRTFKVIRSIYPQVSDYGNGGVNFQFGATEYGENPVTYSEDIPWTAGQYKIDRMASGRYLAWKITCDELTDFQFSGFDADIVPTGKR